MTASDPLPSGILGYPQRQPELIAELFEFCNGAVCEGGDTFRV